MTETQPPLPALDPVNLKLMELGPEFTLGMNTDRHWANGAQVFVTAQQALIVFREQNAIVGEGDIQTVLMRNVTSVVLPTEVLSLIRDAINVALAGASSDGPQS